MAGAEAERRSTAINVAPVVVCVSDMEVAGILGRVGVGVPDKRRLPLYHESQLTFPSGPVVL